jgi:hypothetical protein
MTLFISFFLSSPVGSIANFNKNVNITWEITKDPLCTFNNSFYLRISAADCTTCPRSTVFEVEDTVDKFSQVTTLPRGMSSSITAKFFTAYAQYCNYHVNAKSISFD